MIRQKGARIRKKERKKESCNIKFVPGIDVCASYRVWRTKKQPGFSVNDNKTFISNKITTNIMLHLETYFVVIEECQSQDIPAARGATAITAYCCKNRGGAHPWAGSLFRAPLCSLRITLIQLSEYKLDCSLFLFTKNTRRFVYSCDCLSYRTVVRVLTRHQYK